MLLPTTVTKLGSSVSDGSLLPIKNVWKRFLSLPTSRLTPVGQYRCSKLLAVDFHRCGFRTRRLYSSRLFVRTTLGMTLTSSNSMSHDVLIVSRSSEYFHLDKSYFCLPCAACTDLTNSDLKHYLSKYIPNFTVYSTTLKFFSQKYNYRTELFHLKPLLNNMKSSHYAYIRHYISRTCYTTTKHWYNDYS
jgi:hypothetical protein